jgi:hypothetical protein
VGSGIDLLRRELDAAAEPRLFFFRDDDAGWATARLLALVDLFAELAVPLDLAVIPAALDHSLASTLDGRRERSNGLLAFHQHGFAHANHQRSGRPCEFGPDRAADQQLADIVAGAMLLEDFLGETRPIFTPPWNRCTRTTGRCLLEAGFHTLVRDASADPLELKGLRELAVHVDWESERRGRQLVARRTTGVMLHHALMGWRERAELAQLLRLLTEHEHARCVPLGSQVAAFDPATAG